MTKPDIIRVLAVTEETTRFVVDVEFADGTKVRGHKKWFTVESAEMQIAGYELGYPDLIGSHIVKIIYTTTEERIT